MECDSLEAVDKEIEQHEITTGYRYSKYRSQKDFGNTDVSTAKKVHWKDWPSVKVGRQEFNGIPFVVLNQKSYDCQFGKDRKLKRKQRRKAAKEKTKKDHELYVKKSGMKMIVQDTRKINCPASIIVREICRFPTYQISLDASRFELSYKAEDLLARIRNREDIPFERKFILILPNNNVHTCHKPGENAPEDIDPRLALKIKEMTEAGVRDVESIKLILQSYVADICDPLPDPSSHRFYPRDKIISNHIYEANKGNLKKQEQDSIIRYIQDWQNKKPDDFIYCRLKSSQSSNSTENANIEFGASFLFAYMSAQQKRLVQRYGRFSFLDATYKTSVYDLPMFFVAVRTNCGYQIVATFITEGETADTISEAIRILHANCPSWEPSYFMTDFQESEIVAIESVFTEATVLLCDVHRNRAWDRWCRQKGGDRKEMMKWLMRLGNASNESHFEVVINELQGSNIWIENPKFKHYMEKKWLPQKRRWSKAFRTGLIDIAAGTNNGLESMHKTLKAKFLRWKTTYSLRVLLKILLEDFFPARYQKYVDQNILHSGRFRQYSEEIPKEIQKRPRIFVEHCLKGIALSKSIDRSCVQESERTTEYVVKGDNKDFRVTLGDSELVPNCQCDTWTKFQMPCEHIFAAASDQDGIVQWDLISPLYMQSVYCTIDDMNTDAALDNTEQMQTKDPFDPSLREYKEQEQVGEDDYTSELNDPSEAPLHIQQDEDLSDTSKFELSLSLNAAKVKARESLQTLIAMTYNMTDVHKLHDIKQKADELAKKHVDVALPPLLPLPKRAEILKKRKQQRLSLSKTKKRRQEAHSNVEVDQELWSDVLGKDYFTTEDESKMKADEVLRHGVQPPTSSLPHDFVPQDHQTERNEVERIWKGGQMETKRVGPYYLTSDSIRCINHWLSDEVIDAFLHDLAKKKNVRHINCVTMTAIFDGNPEIHHGLQSEPSIMDCETIVGAHNEGGGHWVLIIVHTQTRTIVYINSLGALPSVKQEIVLKWFKFLKCRFDLGLEQQLPKVWHLQTPPHARQLDGSSCGIYTLKFAENYLDSRPLVFQLGRTDVLHARTSLAMYLLSIATNCDQSLETVEESPEEDLSVHHDSASPIFRSRYPKRKRMPKKISIGCEYTFTSKQLFCVCRKPDDGKLYWHCEKCKEWFHPSCVGENLAEEPDKYYCQSCKDKETEGSFITVRGKRINLQDPDDIANEEEEDRHKEPSVVDESQSIDDDEDIQILGDNHELFKNYDQIMDNLKETVVCDSQRCEHQEHRRHHSFCFNFPEFYQNSSRCHHFGRDFFTLQEEASLTMKLMKELSKTKPDPKRSTGTLAINTLTIVRDGSALDKVLTERRMYSFQYIQFVLLKDYMVMHVSLERGWPIELAEEKCKETEQNIMELRRKKRKQN